MSDFKVKVTADLDTSQLEAKLMALQNRKITIQANANGNGLSNMNNSLQQIQKGNISPSTKRNYKRSWENYIKNTRFGNMTLKDITKSDVILLLKSMSEKGLGKPSINTIVAGVLSPCMKMVQITLKRNASSATAERLFHF